MKTIYDHFTLKYEVTFETELSYIARCKFSNGTYAPKESIFHKSDAGTEYFFSLEEKNEYMSKRKEFEARKAEILSQLEAEYDYRG